MRAEKFLPGSYTHIVIPINIYETVGYKFKRSLLAIEFCRIIALLNILVGF